MFLVRLESGNIECLAISDGRSLKAYDLGIGTYYIIVDNTGSFTYSFQLCETVSSKDLIPNNPITLYPNPNQGTFRIESENNKLLEVNIFNISGKLLMHERCNGYYYDLNHSLDSGFYHLKVKTTKGVVLKSMLVY